jgi:hypothetical protein
MECVYIKHTKNYQEWTAYLGEDVDEVHPCSWWCCVQKYHRFYIEIWLELF